MKIIHKYGTLVIGSGCAGYGAADCLWNRGIKNIAVLTENRLAGTSRNTGSDKQTYYKMSLSGNEGDCPAFMAQTLFDGGAMDGDVALAEAATSVKAYLKLEGLGVEFPQNEYGEFVGYKTDHDPYTRASSVGPYTSRQMTEALEKSVIDKGIDVLSGYQVVKLSVRDGRINGLYALHIHSLEEDFGLVFFSCQNVIVATGGPAIIYRDSVFPVSHTGSSSLLLDAGVRFANAAEWQYGIASTKFRWNLSGSYQQVLPRYVSVDEAGNEYEFLNEYYDDPMESVNNIFLKGYQWPFDSKKTAFSSRIDLLVYNEIAVRKRRVFMDFRRNPSAIDQSGLENLSAEAYTYLKNSGALQALPIERLLAMNPKAYDLYMDHDIDLAKESLEIAVCAQHNNGGAEVDANYETNIHGVFAAGEVACTLGIIRPGGTALNSSQVSGIRIADFLCTRKEAYSPAEPAEEDAEALRSFIRGSQGATSTIRPFRYEMQSIMTEHFAFSRDAEAMQAYIGVYRTALDQLQEKNLWARLTELPQLFKNRDMLLTQLAYAESMLYSANTAGSRGGALALRNGAEIPEDTAYRSKKILTTMEGSDVTIAVRDVRPIPMTRNLWFEKVWKEYLEKRNAI
jgi:succinate dehydrogenase/fumarate reductase flavoprotein subunit